MPQYDLPMELTEREKMIAEEAAKIAVQRMTDEFYKNVGKQFVSKFFILVGALVVGFLVGKGWVKLL